MSDAFEANRLTCRRPKQPTTARPPTLAVECGKKVAQRGRCFVISVGDDHQPPLNHAATHQAEQEFKAKAITLLQVFDDDQSWLNDQRRLRGRRSDQEVREYIK